MNETSVEYKTIDNINHVRYKNIYYINNNFYCLTTEDILIKPVKTLGGPEHSGRIEEKHYELNPIIQKFRTTSELNEFVNSYDIKNINNVSTYLSHYYDHNIAHSLYDALYPIYLAYLNFYRLNPDNNFNIFINLLFVPGWTFPGHASRDWVLKIFQKFCKGEFIIRNDKTQNLKFEILLSGSEYAGIASVNKNAIMPGKLGNTLEFFRDRFFKVYNIPEKPIVDKINILIIDSRRYSSKERNILQKINKQLIKNGHQSNYISWVDYKNFEDQLRLMSNCDIHISGAGTSMMNFPFLNDSKIHINLGVSKMFKDPALLEVNSCLLSNNIYCDFYDIFTHKNIKYTEVMKMINNNINNLNNKMNIKTKIPYYIKQWRELCETNSEMEDIIERMNGKKQPSLVAYRHPEMIIYHHYPYS